jgi:hypothetical protein
MQPQKVHRPVDESINELGVFSWSIPPLPHMFEKAAFVCAVMHNLRPVDMVEGAQALLPELAVNADIIDYKIGSWRATPTRPVESVRAPPSWPCGNKHR